MKWFRLGLWAAVALLGMTHGVKAAPVPYTFDVTTFYQFGVPADLTFADFGTASPDTSYWRITNNGASTFDGTIGQIAVSNFGGDFTYSHVVALAPGASVTFAVNFEASNMGGYNGAFGVVQPGVEIFLTGTNTLGPDSEAVFLSVRDKDIHSGVFKTNPFGETLDNYVLQGGSAFGFDTGDDFEVNQAPGAFRFTNSPAAVPEPSSLAILGLGALGAAFLDRRRRAVAV